MEVSGRTAVVTGGASGIGRGICRALAASGCRVAVADVDGERARAVAEELAASGTNAMAVTCDVTDRTSVERAADAVNDHFGTVHLLCNNAGVGAGGRLDRMAQHTWDWVVAVNLSGVYYCLSVFLPGMLAEPGPAHVLNTASEHALGLPFGGAAAYTATKHAVLGLSDALREDHRDEDLGVSVLCPGLVTTEIWDSYRNRPDRFGGPRRAPKPDGGEPEGMDPDVVGRIAVDGVRRGDFLIMTHPDVRAVAERRCAEVAGAFDTLAGSPGES